MSGRVIEERDPCEACGERPARIGGLCRPCHREHSQGIVTDGGTPVNQRDGAESGQVLVNDAADHRRDGTGATNTPDRDPDPEGVRAAADLIRRERGLEAAITYCQARFATEFDNQAKIAVVLGDLRRQKATREATPDAGGGER